MLHSAALRIDIGDKASMSTRSGQMDFPAGRFLTIIGSPRIAERKGCASSLVGSKPSRFQPLVRARRLAASCLGRLPAGSLALACQKRNRR